MLIGLSIHGKGRLATLLGQIRPHDGTYLTHDLLVSMMV